MQNVLLLLLSPMRMRGGRGKGLLAQLDTSIYGYSRGIGAFAGILWLREMATY